VLNAAEAIREGGRGSGIVRVSAREIGGRDGGKELLDLTFTDDGAGWRPKTCRGCSSADLPRSPKSPIRDSGCIGAPTS